MPTRAPGPEIQACDLCGGVGHIDSACDSATGGSVRLVKAAIDKYAVELGDSAGVQVKLATAIGISKAGLTRIKGGVFEFSPAKRKIVVEYLRTGKLPATPPVRKKTGGREAYAVVASEGESGRLVRCSHRDRYALLKIASLHPLGAIGVVSEALATWTDAHPTRPDQVPSVDGGMSFTCLIDSAVLAAFDTAVGGASERLTWMPSAIAEWVRREEFKPVVGPIPADLEAALEETYRLPRAAAKARARKSEALVRALALSKALSIRGVATTPATYMEGLEASKGESNQLLLSLVATGHLIRVKHGVYQVADPQPNTEPRRLTSKFTRTPETETPESAKA